MTRFRFALMASLFCLPLLTSAQAPPAPLVLPDTTVGKAVGLFVKALNSGSIEELEKFHTDRGDAKSDARQDLEFFQQSGGLDFQRLAKATEFEIAIESKTRKGGRLVVLDFAVDPQAPHPVAQLGVRPMGPGPGGRVGAGGAPSRGEDDGPPRPESEVIAGAPAIIDQAVAEGFSGVVLIAKEGKPVLERASGFANRGFDVKNRLDTKFNLGSINKTFTKLAIAQLMEAGKISLDDKLGKFLPDFPNADAVAKVTVAQLVEMKSGIADFFGKDFEGTPKDRIRTLTDFIPLYAKKPLAFEPGTREAYSNGGYITLGLIIEKVSGQSYYDYVREHIFKPAGMNDTDSFETDAIVPNLAIGYTKRLRAAQLTSNVYALPARGSAAGGGFSTAPDLVKYAEAISLNRLTSLPYTVWYLGGPKPDPKTPPSSLRGGLGIAGGSPGVNGVFELNAGRRFAIVVLSNEDEPAAENLARKVRLGR